MIKINHCYSENLFPQPLLIFGMGGLPQYLSFQKFSQKQTEYMPTEYYNL